MDDKEARLILQAYRPNDADRDDSQFAAALKEVSRNPELARWFGEEQEFDRAMAAQLAAVPAPFGLKTRILAQGATPPARRTGKLGWVFAFASLVAALLLLAQVVSLRRSAEPPTAMMPNYTR